MRLAPPLPVFCPTCRMSALKGIADKPTDVEHVRDVPIADINHHLFRAVVIALDQTGPIWWAVKIRPSIPWHWLASQSAVCFSYLISHLALWLTITAGRPPTVS
jgi:hypothetical protein